MISKFSLTEVQIIRNIGLEALRIVPEAEKYIDISPPINLMNDHYTTWRRKERKGTTSSGRPIFKFRPMAMAANADIKRLHYSIYKNIKLPVSTYVYSYAEGISPKDCAEPHVGKFAVMGIDISRFFPSITRTIIEHIYRDYIKAQNPRKGGLGKDELKSIPKIISMVCSIKDQEEINKEEAVLPIGIEPSTVISNSVPFELDKKLYAMTRREQVRYTRFSDNMFFSMENGHIPRELQKDIYQAIESFTIAGCTPFKMNKRKTRYSPFWRQQRVLGVVVNEKLNIPSYKERYARSALNHLYWDMKDLHDKASEIGRKNVEKIMEQLTKRSRVVFGAFSYFSAVNRKKSLKYSTQITSVKILMDRIKAMIIHEQIDNDPSERVGGES